MNRFAPLFAFCVITLFACQHASAHASLQSFGVTGSSGTNEAFTSIGPQSPRTKGMGYTWPVTVDLGLLGSSPDSVVLNFPDRKAVTLTRDLFKLRGPGAFLWTGRGGDCSAGFSAAASGFRALISCLTGAYDIGLAAQGSGLQLTRYDEIGGASPASAEPPSSAPIALPGSTSTAVQTTTADTALDVLVLYNEQVRQNLDPPGSKVRTVKFMHDCVDFTQMAMVNSTTAGQPTIATLNFVAAKEVSRADSGNILQDRLWVESDPEAIGLRNYWAADIVMYVIENGGGVTGISNIPGDNGLPPPGPAFAPYAVAVIQRNHAISDLSGNLQEERYGFMHEFAHVLGANHNPENTSNPNPLEPWAYGHWHDNVDGGNRTIMSYYTSQCGTLCKRVLNYSNAQVYVDIFHTGVPDQRENARVIQEFTPAAAQYRASLGRIFADGFEF